MLPVSRLYLIDVMLKPQPNLIRCVIWARCTKSVSRLDIH